MRLRTILKLAPWGEPWHWVLLSNCPGPPASPQQGSELGWTPNAGLRPSLTSDQLWGPSFFLSVSQWAEMISPFQMLKLLCYFSFYVMRLMNRCFQEVHGKHSCGLLHPIHKKTAELKKKKKSQNPLTDGTSSQSTFIGMWRLVRVSVGFVKTGRTIYLSLPSIHFNFKNK